MKKKLFKAAMMLLGVILTVGCTSDPIDQTGDQNQENQEIPVTFIVSPLSVSTGEIPTTRATVTGSDLANILKEVGYLIYKDGVLVKSGSVSYNPATQEAPENFGTMEEKLLPGAYYVVFYAFGKYGSTAQMYNKDVLDQFYFYEYDTSNNTELFLYQGDLTVTSSTTEVNITLDRKSGLLSVQISDDPIDEAAYLKFDIQSYYRYYPKPRMEWYKTEYKWTYSCKTNITNGELPETKIYFIYPKTPTNLTISIYDSDNQLLGSQELEVPLYANRRTIVSGNLFTNLGDKPLTFSVNDSWGTDVQVNLN